MILSAYLRDILFSGYYVKSFKTSFKDNSYCENK